ncbi:MAG TPA: PIN domain-containing protein [Thermoanaerobaculia bacterium]|nr:PIN domain-containing protein [Thermoanaerobaculia bacterium]
MTRGRGGRNRPRLDLFPAAARDHLESDDELLISPMVALELDSLHEIGRVQEPSPRVLTALRGELGLRTCELPFARVVAAAREASWTRDPFDRLIMGQAAARQAPLLTRDQQVRERYPQALWDEETMPEPPPTRPRRLSVPRLARSR